MIYLTIPLLQILEAEQMRLNDEASFLCRTLSDKQYFYWEELRENPPTKCDSEVVGALMALGQRDINMEVLDQLEDRSGHDFLHTNGVRLMRELEIAFREFYRRHPDHPGNPENI